jgi:hypothetical protein
LVGKPELCVFKDGSRKLLHSFLSFSTKLCGPLARRINKFSSVDEDNVILREAEIFLEEVNDDCTDFFPCFIGLINGKD